MTLFKNQVHQDIWIEAHCGQCWRNNLPGSIEDKCPILHWALGHGRKPVEWERNTRKNVLMQDTYKCSEETRTPPIIKHAKTFEDEPMFDVDAPIDMDTDHA